MSGKSQKRIRERGKNMEQNTKIMLKIADILLQDHLITPEEKLHLKQLIQRGESV